MKTGDKVGDSVRDRLGITIRNPATGEEIGRITAMDRDEVSLAVETAVNAQAAWGIKPVRERGRVLFRGAARVREKMVGLATLLTREQGKPLAESTDEVRGFANILEFHASLASSVHGEVHQTGLGTDAMVTYEPLGVCAAVIPWNMPVLILGWKAGPALLAGNALVVKPSSTTPLTTIALAEILHEAGLPEGILQIVIGTGEVTGEALVSHPAVAKVSFTGNERTGMRVRQLAAGHLCEVVLELGGSDPMIVCRDADLPAAVRGAVRGRFYNAGQTCTAIKRVFVEEPVATEFTALLADEMSRIRVGNGLVPGVGMGPLHRAEDRLAISRLVSRTVEQEEGNIVAGGVAPGGDEYAAGHFYLPTLVTSVAPGSPLLTEEVFGPVLPVMTVPDLDTAITEANRSRFGLGASVWTRDLGTARKAFSDLRAGVVWVNRHLTIPPEIPFGGTGASGIGRENGVHAWRSYSRSKSLFLAW